MNEAVIVAGVRTAVGKAPRGALRTTRPDRLGAIVVKGVLEQIPDLIHARSTTSSWAARCPRASRA